MRAPAAIVTVLLAGCGTESLVSPDAPQSSTADAPGPADAPRPADAPPKPADAPPKPPDAPPSPPDAPPSPPDAPPSPPADAGARAGPGVRPNAGNTGVPPGVTLTVVEGDLVVTDDGASVDARDVHGFLIIRASNVHVTRCLVRGRATSGNASVIDVQSGTGAVIEDTEVAVAFPSAGVDGFGGSHFTVRRLDIHGGVDGMKAGSASTIEYTYIHDLMSFDHDPNQGGGPTHNDAIQILEGTTIHVTGNTLLPAKSQNAAIQITEDFGTVTDVHVDANYADGGGCTFNFSHKGAASLDGLTTTNNRFGRNSFFNCPILKSTQTHLDSSGDVWDDDGTPVPIQTHD